MLWNYNVIMQKTLTNILNNINNILKLTTLTQMTLQYHSLNNHDWSLIMNHVDINEWVKLFTYSVFLNLLQIKIIKLVIDTKGAYIAEVTNVIL